MVSAATNTSGCDADRSKPAVAVSLPTVTDGQADGNKREGTS
jgi:hypothetical protein